MILFLFHTALGSIDGAPLWPQMKVDTLMVTFISLDQDVTPTDSFHNSQFPVSQLPQEFCLRRSPQLCNPAVGMAFQGLPWPTSLPPSCGSWSTPTRSTTVSRALRRTSTSTIWSGTSCMSVRRRRTSTVNIARSHTVGSPTWKCTCALTRNTWVQV